MEREEDGGCKRTLFTFTQNDFSDCHRAQSSIVVNKNDFPSPINFFLLDHLIHSLELSSVQILVNCFVLVKHFSVYEYLRT